MYLHRYLGKRKEIKVLGLEQIYEKTVRQMGIGV